MKKHSVIIDCDTGTDDAVAIIAALGSEELEIRAITTVCGNVDLAYTAANTLNLVRMLGFDTPVARGAERPLLRDITQLRASDKEAPGGFGTHGQTGMGNVRLLESSDSFYEKNAVETIYEQAVQCKGELEIIALGPQTNLALALNVYPELKRMIKCIYFMGGAVEGGNSSAVAEFNIFFDPEAAKIVFGSGIPLVMVGLDVTLRAVLSDSDCNGIRGIGTTASDIAADLLDFMRMRRDVYKGEDVVMHDALAVMAICRPEYLRTHDYYVDVECAGTYTYGHTYVQKSTRFSNNMPNCRVALDVDSGAFAAWMKNCIRQCAASGTMDKKVLEA